METGKVIAIGIGILGVFVGGFILGSALTPQKIVIMAPADKPSEEKKPEQEKKWVESKKW